MMRRSLLLVLIISGLVAIIWYANYADKANEARTVYSLKNGGEVQLLAVTYGKTHTISLDPPPTLRARLRSAREQRSWGPLFNPPPLKSSSISKPSECLCVWFRIRSKINPIYPEDAKLILPNNQRFLIRTGGLTQDTNRGAIVHLVLPVIPTRERHLRFDGKVAGEPVTFAFKNPAFGTRPSKWKAEELPQTKTNSGVSVTLAAISLAPENAPGHGSWVPQCRLNVVDNGSKANGWYSIKTRIEDESGNSYGNMALLSEPVWRVRATLARNSSYPRKADQIQWVGPVDRWFGTIDPAHASALGENAYELFALPDPPGTVRLAGVFGKGEFDLTADGKVSKPTWPPGKPTSVSYDRFGKVYKLSLSSPSFVLWSQEVNREDADLGYVLRSLDDKPYFMFSQALSGTNRGSVTIYRLPSQPVRIGVAPHTLEFEFYVKPPATPAPTQQTDR